MVAPMQVRLFASWAAVWMVLAGVCAIIDYTSTLHCGIHMPHPWLSEL